MSEEAYQEGWRENDPMADIRRYRTEIALCEVFGRENKKNTIELAELNKLAAENLNGKYKFVPDSALLARALDVMVRIGQLARDPAHPEIVLKGARF